MSFILDALKKLEQKRQQDELPNLSTIHTPNLHKPKKGSKWPYLLLIALLLNAGILTAWLRPWSSDVENTSVQTHSSESQDVVSSKKLSDSTESVLPEKPAELIKPAAVKQTPSVKPEDGPSAIVTAQPEPVEEETLSTDSNPDEQIVSLDLSPSVDELDNLKKIIKEERELTQTSTIPQEESSSEQNENKPEREILELSELPAEVRNKIPDISINGHIYSSNSSSRLTNINGSLVREGDTVTGKLKVKEITMTGVIFDYEGLRFRVRAF